MASAGIDKPLKHLTHNLLVHLRDGGGQLVAPGLVERPPAQRLGLHVDHTTAGHSGWGGYLHLWMEQCGIVSQLYILCSIYIISLLIHCK